MLNNTLTVNTTAVQVPVGAAQTPLVVNSGTTIIYLGNTNGTTAANGIPLGPNVGYQFPQDLVFAGWNQLWVISSGAGGQIRYATVG